MVVRMHAVHDQPITQDLEDKLQHYNDQLPKIQPYQYLKIPVLREYLAKEFAFPSGYLPFDYNFERIIDDFVFLCFFVGNDFLPHLPCLDIREGALDQLMEIYKRVLPTLGGYVTFNGELDMTRVERLLAEVGLLEEYVFRERERQAQRDKQRKEQNKQRNAQSFLSLLTCRFVPPHTLYQSVFLVLPLL